MTPGSNSIPLALLKFPFDKTTTASWHVASYRANKDRLGARRGESLALMFDILVPVLSVFHDTLAPDQQFVFVFSRCSFSDVAHEGALSLDQNQPPKIWAVQRPILGSGMMD